MQDETIVLTRSEELCSGLAQQITEQGGRAIIIPALDIQPTVPEPVDPSEFDILIFVSRNAVKFALQSIPGLLQNTRTATIYCMGLGSRKELMEQGFDPVVHAPGKGGSEALLAMPDLQQENVSGRRVTILSGVGGLDLLEVALHKRGARVQRIDLYRRQKPEIAPALMSQTWQVDKPNVVVIYSGEGMQNLLSLVSREDRAVFLQTPLLVISSRLKELAQTSGFEGEIGVADSYADDAILEALEKLIAVNKV